MKINTIVHSIGSAASFTHYSSRRFDFIQQFQLVGQNPLDLSKTHSVHAPATCTTENRIKSCCKDISPGPLPTWPPGAALTDCWTQLSQKNNPCLRTLPRTMPAAETATKRAIGQSQKLHAQKLLEKTCRKINSKSPTKTYR